VRPTSIRALFRSAMLLRCSKRKAPKPLVRLPRPLPELGHETATYLATLSGSARRRRKMQDWRKTKILSTFVFRSTARLMAQFARIPGSPGDRFWTSRGGFVAARPPRGFRRSGGSSPCGVYGPDRRHCEVTDETKCRPYPAVAT